MERFESPESALIRELDEELAITLYESELVPVTFAAGPAAPNRPDESLVILLYSCRTWRGDPRCLAGEELAWFEASRINDLAMPPLDYPLAEGLIVALETGRS